MTGFLARIFAAVDAAIQAVIDDAVDRIVSAWVEEEPSPLCGNPTKARES